MTSVRSTTPPWAVLGVLAGIALTHPSAAAQAPHDADAPRVEQAALALVKLLDDGRYDEAAATIGAGTARLVAGTQTGTAPTGAIVLGTGGRVMTEADARRSFDVRRERGRLANRQATLVFVEPLQSRIVTGRDPAKQIRSFSVEFDSDPEAPMLDRRRNAARFYRETVGGFLLPSGDLVVTAYSGAPAHASDRVRGAGPAAAAGAAAAGTGTAAPEAAAAELALAFAQLLDEGRDAEALSRIRAASPEHYGTDALWRSVEQRLRADFGRRTKRGALTARKVVSTSRDGGQGTYTIVLATTGAVAPNPPRYGPNPLESIETLRVQVFGGAARVLDYRFGF